MRPTQRLVGIFIITILAPSLILGFFALRALRQERELADQQLRERLTLAAEGIGRRLEVELSEWQLAADRIAHGVAADREKWPDRLRAISATPGGAVVLYRDGSRIATLPPGQVLYELSQAPPRPKVTAVVRQNQSRTESIPNYGPRLDDLARISMRGWNPISRIHSTMVVGVRYFTQNSAPFEPTAERRSYR